MENTLTVLISVILIAGALLPYMKRHRRKEREVREQLATLRVSGSSEASLVRPAIDPLLCIGCGSCVRACPEGDVLGLVGGRSVLVHPSKCVGHGLCADACAAGAITLVIGAGKGADLPILDGQMQTTVPGVYIVGELGGLGLIRNAVTQGAMVVEHISRCRRQRRTGCDIAIVGAGPAGLSAALAAKEHNLSYALLEQGEIGGSILHYPRQKMVLTSPVDIPHWGRLRTREISKESLLSLWHTIIRDTKLEVRTNERVVNITRDTDGFTLETSAGRVTASSIVLAMGRRGTPRTLGVPGEELSKVMYRLIDAGAFAGSKILVVGGGDSAVEAAVGLGLQKGTSVTLSYRRSSFSRVKERNMRNLQTYEKSGRITVRLESEVVSISPNAVQLSTSGTTLMVPNDFVFVFAGGVTPTAFLKGIGLRFHGDAQQPPVLQTELPRAS